MIELFSMFQGRYGNKWAKDYATRDQITIGTGVWSDKLDQFSDAEIEGGFKRWNSKWPPCADEFAEECKAVRERARSFRKCLQKPKPTAKLAWKHIHKMRESLR